MPTKTERILGYLPSTFRARPRPTALYALADAFGGELLNAENTLAELMLAHWVDHADEGKSVIDDLARLAALYGLAPSSEEDVEQFRDHLKRYVRTLLQGTVTVQGVLRVAAEALGLRIADDYAEMQAWWTRPEAILTASVPRGDDAALLVFGVDAGAIAGQPATPAHVVGTIDVGAGVDLRGASVLRVAIDAAPAVDVDLALHVADAAAARPDEIVAALDAALGARVAGHDGRHLTLASPTLGAASRLVIEEVAGDAAPRLLGLRGRAYHGVDATSARVTGTVDLSGGVDLGDLRYLRLVVDGHRAEVDCAGAHPAATTLDEIAAAIDAALGMDVASHDGRVLTLTSPTTGFDSSITFEAPAAQDATARLFGPVAPLSIGRDARPAEVVGARDLSAGVDLSGASDVRVRIDARPAVTVNCRGTDPAHTTPAEIVAALTAALGPNVASHDGRVVRLSAQVLGAAGLIVFEAGAADATEAVFGVEPRSFQGSAATGARLTGVPDLATPVDLAARHVVRVALDGGPSTDVDLRATAANPRAATLDEIVSALGAAVGIGVASHDGHRLILTSPTGGGASRVAVERREETRHRRFVSRAFVTDDAAQSLFGFVFRTARGAGATAARAVGTVDLSRGVDLRVASFLRIGLDGRPAVDVDCTARSPRPGAALLDEIVAAVNAAIPRLASHDGRHLVLTSPTSGAASLIAFESPRAADALPPVLGHEPATFRGRAESGVRVAGTVDLSDGVDLSGADMIKVAIDADAPREIHCAGAVPARTMLVEIVNAINVAFGRAVAGFDETRVTLGSPITGTASRIEFSAPAGPDATRRIFGFGAPRRYHGADPLPARIEGTVDLHAGIDLRVSHFLTIAVDGRPPQDVDCAARAADPHHATLDEIVAAMTAALGPGVATHDGAHVILTSPTVGAAGRLELRPFSAGDARQVVLGGVPVLIKGADPTPAVMTGEADLSAPPNLGERRRLRLSVDGGRPVDVEVASADGPATSLSDVVTRINAVLPGVADATADNRLRLTSPTAGDAGRLEVLPSRVLEVVEYVPEPVASPARTVRHGDQWSLDNDGAADAELEIELSGLHGMVGPELINRSAARRVRLLHAVRPGERVRLWHDPLAGLRAAIVASDGALTPVPPSQILAGPLGAQALVPFTGEWSLSGGTAGASATLQLNNPSVPVTVVLRARPPGTERDRIAVSVTEADLGTLTSSALAADGTPRRVVGRVGGGATGHRLVDVAGATLADLRAGAGVVLDDHRDRVVAAYGSLHAGTPAPVMIVEHIADLFDVSLRDQTGPGAPETYRRVTIGDVPASGDGLTARIMGAPSQLVQAEDVDKAAALALPRGRTAWTYTECYAARFDHARFDAARFAGGGCFERAIFNVSRFPRRPPGAEAPVFGHAGPIDDPPVDVTFRWTRHAPGTFVLNLPDDLPERFGGRFNDACFGSRSDASESYASVVTEPAADADYIGTRVASSKLIAVLRLDTAPPGVTPVAIPFRRPRTHRLTGGTSVAPARLYLFDPGAGGVIEVTGRQPGPWGNAIALTVLKAGAGRFDLTVHFEGARFENARALVLGPPLPALAQALLAPGPLGVRQAKAAGVRAGVARASAEPIY
ncbi:MAG TPA: hypothetical protein VK548_24140 [Candidatus Acidoferrum sp.]|nr:hypothetical protein [Candidatus Acidoferrum sp.]